MEKVIEEYIVTYDEAELKQAISNYCQIFLFGAGSAGKKILETLSDCHISITAIVVSDKSENPDKIMGIDVVGLEEIDVGDTNIFILGVSRKFEHQVVKTLLDKGHTHIAKLANTKWKKNIGMPKLEITVKMGCNVQCKYCPQSDLLRAYFEQDKDRENILSLDNFKKAINNMPDNTIITFSGFAEPFLNSDAIEMIEYAHKKGHFIELYTTLINISEEEFDRIKDIPFRKVVLHTPDKMNYAIIPITDTYKKVMDKALSHKKPNGEPFIDSANCQSEPSEDFLKIANGRIKVESTLIDRAGLLEGEDLLRSEHKKGKLVCKRSYFQNHWVLLPDGTVVLCCMDFGLKHMLGNLFQKNYGQICEDVAYTNVRSMMSSCFDERDILCCECTASMEVL